MQRIGTLGKLGLAVLGFIILILTSVVIAAHLLEDRFRAYAEREVNSRIQDYHVRIGDMKLYPLRLAVQLSDVTVSQHDHPEPAILHFDRGRAKLFWSGLIRGTVRADLRLHSPTVHITDSQRRAAQRDAREAVPSVEEQQTWQDQLLDMVPLALTVAVHNGTILYEQNDQPVFRLTDLEVMAGPVRNVKANRGDYPTPVYVKSQLQDGGSLQMKAHVDLFAKPDPAGMADITVRDLELKPLAPVVKGYHVSLHRGRVGFDAHVEYAPWGKRYDIRDLTVANLVSNYIYEPAASKPEKEAAKHGARKTAEVAEQPETQLLVQRATIRNSEFGVVHAGVDPPYRVFVTDTSADLRNVSNRLRDQDAEVRVTGRFMASGQLEARGVFRPDPASPAFDLSVKVEQTEIKMLNDLLRAHGHLDVVGGRFTVYSQFGIEDRRIEGYVKPVVQELKVYDKDQERGKGLMETAYEAVVGKTAEALTNRQTREAGTEIHVTGTIENMDMDTWQAAVRLVQNAFFQLVVPRFDRPVRPRPEAVLTLK